MNDFDQFFFRIKPERNGIFQIFFAQPFEFFALGPLARERQADLVRIFGTGDGADENVLPFFGSVAPDHEDIEKLLRLGARRFGRTEISRHAVGNDVQFRLVFMFPELVGNEYRRAMDMVEILVKFAAEPGIDPSGDKPAAL